MSGHARPPSMMIIATRITKSAWQSVRNTDGKPNRVWLFRQTIDLRQKMVVQDPQVMNMANTAHQLRLFAISEAEKKEAFSARAGSGIASRKNFIFLVKVLIQNASFPIIPGGAIVEKRLITNAEAMPIQMKRANNILIYRTILPYYDKKFNAHCNFAQLWL